MKTIKGLLANLFLKKPDFFERQAEIKAPGKVIEFQRRSAASIRGHENRKARLEGRTQ